MALTVPRALKQAVLEAAAVLEWSAGDWVLAAAAEHGGRLHETLGHLALPRRASVEDTVLLALYLTAEEREELDELARRCGLNRSAFVTAVARIGLGEGVDDVVVSLRAAAGGHVDRG